ncbi:unnamed protein product [Penicillium bialowiezense]
MSPILCKPASRLSQRLPSLAAPPAAPNRPSPTEEQGMERPERVCQGTVQKGSTQQADNQVAKTDEAKVDKANKAGTQDTKRVINTIEGDEGVLELFSFVKGWVNELPSKAFNSTKSTADKAELEETRLDVQQALLQIERLIQEMKRGVEIRCRFCGKDHRPGHRCEYLDGVGIAIAAAVRTRFPGPKPYRGKRAGKAVKGTPEHYYRGKVQQTNDELAKAKAKAQADKAEKARPSN